MIAGPRAWEELEQESCRIVGMICSENVSEGDLGVAISALRRRTEEAFPERPRLFEETFGRRFSRLRTRFHPTASLLPTLGVEGDRTSSRRPPTAGPVREG